MASRSLQQLDGGDDVSTQGGSLFRTTPPVPAGIGEAGHQLQVLVAAGGLQVLLGQLGRVQE